MTYCYILYKHFQTIGEFLGLLLILQFQLPYKSNVKRMLYSVVFDFNFNNGFYTSQFVSRFRINYCHVMLSNIFSITILNILNSSLFITVTFM